MLNSDLSSFWLELLHWGCQDAAQLQWLDHPPESALAVAQYLLRRLGAIDNAGYLTRTGRMMAMLGCEPRLAAMLCAGAEQGAEALATAALLAELSATSLAAARQAAHSALIPAGWQKRQSCQQR